MVTITNETVRKGSQMQKNAYCVVPCMPSPPGNGAGDLGGGRLGGDAEQRAGGGF